VIGWKACTCVTHIAPHSSVIIVAVPEGHHASALARAPNKADEADEDDGEGVGDDVVEVVSLLVDPEHTRKIDRVPLPHQQRQAVHGGAESQEQRPAEDRVIQGGELADEAPRLAHNDHCDGNGAHAPCQPNLHAKPKEVLYRSPPLLLTFAEAVTFEVHEPVAIMIMNVIRVLMHMLVAHPTISRHCRLLRGVRMRRAG